MIITQEQYSKLPEKYKQHFEKQGNFHPTVKPIALLAYLQRLITPPNGIILDPFMGSGSGAISAYKEGFQYIGIELEKEYFDIAVARLKGVTKQGRFDL